MAASWLHLFRVAPRLGGQVYAADHAAACLISLASVLLVNQSAGVFASPLPAFRRKPPKTSQRSLLIVLRDVIAAQEVAISCAICRPDVGPHHFEHEPRVRVVPREGHAATQFRRRLPVVGSTCSKEKHGSNRPRARAASACPSGACSCCAAWRTHTTCSGSHAAGVDGAPAVVLRRRPDARASAAGSGVTTKSVPLASSHPCVHPASSSPRTRVAAMACIIRAVQFSSSTLASTVAAGAARGAVLARSGRNAIDLHAGDDVPGSLV